MTKRELTGITVDEIQRNRHDDVDADDEQVELPECRQDAPRDQSLQHSEQHEGESEHNEIIFP